MSRPRWKSLLAVASLVVLGLVIVAQVVPYGRNHSNPPIGAEPSWNSSTTRALAARACFDCHSNQTRWPWYSHVAPMSWLVQNHVDEGRGVLNFSEWNRGNSEAGEAAETVREREMPPRSYLLLHPEARLTDAEREQLALGLDASLVPTRQSRADQVSAGVVNALSADHANVDITFCEHSTIWTGSEGQRWRPRI